MPADRSLVSEAAATLLCLLIGRFPPLAGVQRWGFLAGFVLPARTAVLQVHVGELRCLQNRKF